MSSERSCLQILGSLPVEVMEVMEVMEVLEVLEVMEVMEVMEDLEVMVAMSGLWVSILLMGFLMAMIALGKVSPRRSGHLDLLTFAVVRVPELGSAVYVFTLHY